MTKNSDEKLLPSIDPTEKDLNSPEFNAIWNVIKEWDIQRNKYAGYAGATGTDVMAILNALRRFSPSATSDVESNQPDREVLLECIEPIPVHFKDTKAIKEYEDRVINEIMHAGFRRGSPRAYDICWPEMKYCKCNKIPEGCFECRRCNGWNNAIDACKSTLKKAGIVWKESNDVTKSTGRKEG